MVRRPPQSWYRVMTNETAPPVTGLQWLDWVLIVLYAVSTIGLGLYLQDEGAGAYSLWASAGSKQEMV